MHCASPWNVILARFSLQSLSVHLKAKDFGIWNAKAKAKVKGTQKEHG